MAMTGSLVVGRLPDGRFQGWMYDAFMNKLYTFVQTSSTPLTLASALSEFPMPDALTGMAYDAYFYMPVDAVNGLALNTLPDGRLELWLAGSLGVFTCVMLTSDANSQWSKWWQICDSPTPVPWVKTLAYMQQYQQQYQQMQIQKGIPVQKP